MAFSLSRSIVLGGAFAAIFSVQAQAGYPRSSEMLQVQRLAAEISNNAAQVYNIMNTLNSPPSLDLGLQSALQQVNRYQLTAREFLNRVQIFYTNPSQTESAFDQLQSSYIGTRNALLQAPSAFQALSLLEQGGRSLQELQRYYSARPYSSWNSARVQQNAYDLEREARELRIDVEREAGGNNFNSNIATQDARQLENQARTYSLRLQAYPEDPDMSVNDFNQLVNLAYRLRSDLSYSRYSSFTMTQLERVLSVLNELQRAYQNP